jgi:hypothetical protein
MHESCKFVAGASRKTGKGDEKTKAVIIGATMKKGARREFT